VTYGRLVGLALNDRNSSDRLNTVGLIGSEGVKRIGLSAFIRAFSCSPLTGTDCRFHRPPIVKGWIDRLRLRPRRPATGTDQRLKPTSTT
jgi:hypothetical protein